MLEGSALFSQEYHYIFYAIFSSWAWDVVVILELSSCFIECDRICQHNVRYALSQLIFLAALQLYFFNSFFLVDTFYRPLFINCKLQGNAHFLSLGLVNGSCYLT